MSGSHDRIGTWTEGQISYQAAPDLRRQPLRGAPPGVLFCNLPSSRQASFGGRNQVDAALWRFDPSAADLVAGYQRIAGVLPFDHDPPR